jgi:prevent-host-death family protein
MSAEPIPAEVEVAVSDARSQLADLVDQAEAGKVIYLTRHGRRVAALAPADMPTQAASARSRAFARRFAQEHPELLDRLAQ